MKEFFEENWSCLQCGQCKFYGKKCKRIDHKHIKFAKPFFKSYDCGQFFGTVCRDFYPADYCIWLKKHWISYDDYYQNDEFKGTVSFCIDDDFEVRYKVKTEDFINGTMYDDKGNLKWIEKEYYKKRKVSKRHPIGYELIHERRDL